MRKYLKSIVMMVLCVSLCLMTACSQSSQTVQTQTTQAAEAESQISESIKESETDLIETGETVTVSGDNEIAEDGNYTTKEDVALYIHVYGDLPDNFITKKEAKKLGWEGGSLEPYAPGKSIGGDHFGNREGVLPKYGQYTECDIDTMGAKNRGAKRIVFSDDGRIYYTEDHYETFTLLYGEEK